MPLSAHGVRGETIMQYKVNGSAEMTDKALVRARLRAWSGDRRRQW